jgi:hypothetical protein
MGEESAVSGFLFPSRPTTGVVSLRSIDVEDRPGSRNGVTFLQKEKNRKLRNLCI